MKKGYLIIAALLLIVCIWRAPLSPWVRLNFEHALIWAAMIALSYCIAIKINLWMGLFLLLASFSAYYPLVSKFSQQSHKLILMGVIWYVVCVQFLNTEKSINFVLDIVCVIALANALMLVLQYYNYDPIHATVPTKYESQMLDTVPNVGLMSCHNGASAMLAMTFPAFLRSTRNAFGRLPFTWFIFIPFLLIGLVISHTFAGPLSLVVAIIIMTLLFFKTRHMKILSFILVGTFSAIALILYIYFVDVPDTAWRLDAWKIALFKLYPQHWIFGSGVGHWKIVYTKAAIALRTNNEIMAQAHNEFIQGLFEFGVFFPLLVIGYAVDIWRRYREAAILPLMAVIIIAVNSMAFFPFHIGLSAMMALTWMAILEVRLRGKLSTTS